MTAKQIVYSRSARRAHPPRRQHPRRRRQGHARPEGPQRRHREELRLAGRHEGRRHRRQGDRARRQAREHGRADGARGRVARRATRPATARRPPPCSRRRSTRRASRLVEAGHNPMDLKRGIDAAVAAIVAEVKKLVHADEGQGARSRRSARSAPTATPTIGNMLADAMEKVGKEGVITVEEAKGMSRRARGGRGHAVRPRLPLAVLRHRTRRR